MKLGEIIKSHSEKVSSRDLELINKYTRRPYSIDELYIFDVSLCDNDVDRDFERFTVEALFELEKLFVGKTGISDHNPKAENQTARIFECRVENVEGKKTQTGDDYFRLVGRAYMPKCDSNKAIIEKLESGIAKEVSVGCSMGKSLCSVCGADMRGNPCTHRKGHEYAGKLCYHELCEATDAYEWSFVAVPAQRQAGVIKGFLEESGKDINRMKDIIKSLEKAQDLSLGGEDAKRLYDYIKSLEELSKEGKHYRSELCDEVLRLSALREPKISRKTMENAIRGLSLSELREFLGAYKSKEEAKSVKLQLLPNKEKTCSAGNKEFKI